MLTIDNVLLDRDPRLGDVYIFMGEELGRLKPRNYYELRRLGPKIVSLQNPRNVTNVFGESYRREEFDKWLEDGTLRFEYNRSEHGAYGQRKGPHVYSKDSRSEVFVKC